MASSPPSSGASTPTTSSPPSSGTTTPASSSPPSSVNPRKKMSVREMRPDSLNGDDMSADVAFMIKLKSARVAGVEADDLSTLAPSECSGLTDLSGADTDTTLVDERNQELDKQVAMLDREVQRQRRKIERLEKRNRELLEKEAAAAQSSAAETERVKLLHTIHRLSTMNEDLQDEKRSLELRVEEMSRAVEQKSPSLRVDRKITDLRMRLSKAESLVEDLQEENDDLKHQITEMENEMEEIQDSFCEDQVEEYQDLKKQLEQANKNGRVIQFKLRKVERSIEEVQQDKESLEKQLKDFKESGGICREEVEKLKTELKLAKEVSVKLGEEVEQLRSQGKTATGKPPMRRQASASDESRLLRELQDALEREADLKEQMRFAEQDAAELRKKLVRIEEENDSLTLQLRKMASKSRRRNSQDRILDGDEGISEDLDELSPHELRIQLELNEMETATLRRKIEKMEQENETLQLQINELQHKPSSPKLRKFDSAVNIDDPNAYYEHRINVLEDEMNDVRKKLIQRERENDFLKTEMQMNHKRGSSSFARARSLDLPETGSLSRKRRVQSCSPEHEATEIDKTEQLATECSQTTEAEQKRGQNGINGAGRASLGNGQISNKIIDRLEQALTNQKQEFEDLTRKYELLEEDYVISKAQISLEKEQLDGEYTVLKHEYDTAQSELKTLRETYNTQQDQWMKEKLALEQRVKEAEKRWGGRADELSWKLEKTRLQESLREKNEDIDRLEKSKLSQKKDIEDIRKEMERQLTNSRAANSKSSEKEKLHLQEDAASSKRKIDQLQEDLVELRAAHAKLRESHRRVLRERDRCDRERTEVVGRHQELLRATERQEGRVTQIAEQIEKVSDLIPLVIKGSKLYGQREKDHEQLQETVTSLTDASKELRGGLKVLDDAREQCPQARRQRSYQRSASAGASPAGAGAGAGEVAGAGCSWGYRSPYPSLPGSPLQLPSSQLNRRAASMGLRGNSQDSVYHREEGSVESLGPFHYQTLPRIKLNDDPNFDRVSTESTQSEIVSGVAPVKKKGPLRGLLKAWSRTKSVDSLGSNSDLRAPSTDSKTEGVSPATETPQLSAITRTEPGPKLKKKISMLFKTTSPTNTRKEDSKSELESEQEAKMESEPGKKSKPESKSESKSETKKSNREPETEPKTEQTPAADSAAKRDEPALATTATSTGVPFRNPPVAVRTPLSVSPAASRAVSMSRPTATSSTSLLRSSAARRASRRTTPKITISPTPVRRAPLVFSTFTRARARFES